MTDTTDKFTWEMGDIVFDEPSAYAEWDESKHPRHPGGSEAGGEFAPAGGGGDVTETPAFKKWFGDSKVVDKGGKPLVVYHGTRGDVQVLESEHEGLNSNIFGTWNTKRSGIFFTPDSAEAGFYAGTRGGENANIIPAYLSIDKPLDLREFLDEGVAEKLDAIGYNSRYLLSLDTLDIWEAFDKEHGGDHLVSALKQLGYDGVRLSEVNTESGKNFETWVAFHPEQIKSKFNTGTFDPTDKRISYEWDESKHPRKPAGSEAGGEFAPSEAGEREFFHGSPHLFDVPDTAHMGTGEGAQTFGWGLYLAENQKVAETYRSSGNMYSMKVSEATINKMLDLDKPLKDQVPSVKKALEPILKSPSFRHGRPAMVTDADMTARAFDEQKTTGLGFLDALEQSLGSGDERKRAASEMLLKAGIPGNKYLDMGSRVDWTKVHPAILGGKELPPIKITKPTYNLVLFDAKHIKATKRLYSFPDSAHNYRAKTSYERRVDFKLAKHRLDVTETKVKERLKAQLRQVQNDLIAWTQVTTLDSNTVRYLPVASLPEFQRTLQDMFEQAWTNGRDAGVKELPRKVKKRPSLQAVRTFAWDYCPCWSDDAEWHESVLDYAEWDESKHPRHPSGSEAGGEFAPGESDIADYDPAKLPWSGQMAVPNDWYDLMGNEGELGKVKVLDSSKIFGNETVGKSGVENLKKIISDPSGDLPPIVVQREGDKYWVIDGHHRLQAAIELGYKKIPVREVIEDNKTYANAFEPTEAMRAFENRAWMIKDVIDSRLQSAVRQELFEHLKGGRTMGDTISRLRDIFAPYVGDPSSGAPGSLLSAARLENIVRTETTWAYNQGRLAVGDALGDYILGYQFSAILDERTTETCQTADGLVLQKDDATTIQLTPPLHFQCRSMLVYVTVDDSPVDWSSDKEIDAAVSLIQAGFK